VGRIVGKSNQLTAVSVNAKKVPGYYLDGNGLYLRVASGGSKSWLFRFMLHGKAREMGLGSLATFSLSEARERARECRQLLADGIDPINHRASKVASLKVESANRKTFEQCANEYIASHSAAWRNAKHAQQWPSTLKLYAYPIFGSKDISDVAKADILAAVEPIWSSKTETASRVLQRVRTVIEWSVARDFRKNHDATLWDQIKRALPKKEKVQVRTHFASCPYANAAEAVKSILSAIAEPTLKNALLFTILNAARSGEVRGATSAEIDKRDWKWVIPGDRMKSGKEHRVPLSSQSIAILKEQDSVGLIFGNMKGKPYSDMAMTMLLRRLGHEFTVHGFRSTFRDWAAEQTSFPSEVAEAALAHSLKDKTEAAYFRSDLFEKRRQLMQAWADYCMGGSTPNP